MCVGKNVGNVLFFIKTESNRQVTVQQSYRIHHFHIFATVVNPRQLHIRFVGVKRDGKCCNRDKKFISRHFEAFFDDTQLCACDTHFALNVTEIVFSRFVVDWRVGNPIIPVIPLLKILAAFLIKRRMRRILSLFQR